jgi:Domain of unknown function (DUF4440)
VQAGDIVRCEQQRIAALLAADMPTLWALHAPHYQLITPAGTVFSRERYLGMIEAGTLRYQRWEPGEMAVRAAATMAIVRYRVVLQLGQGADPGTPLNCWHTDSYELLEDGWQAVWSQATQLRG